MSNNLQESIAQMPDTVKQVLEHMEELAGGGDIYKNFLKTGGQNEKPLEAEAIYNNILKNKDQINAKVACVSFEEYTSDKENYSHLALITRKSFYNEELKPAAIKAIKDYKKNVLKVCNSNKMMNVKPCTGGRKKRRKTKKRKRRRKRTKKKRKRRRKRTKKRRRR